MKYAAFVILTFLAICPRLVKTKTNVVTHTYAYGATALFKGTSPYSAPERATRDWYKYSPLYAMFYLPIAQLSPTSQALVWALVNILFFWAGLFAWCPRNEKYPYVLWVALILASVELNISLLYQQNNALLVGLVLLGLAFYRDKRFPQSATCLALATSFKIIPLLLVAPLFLLRNRKYVSWFFGVSMLGVLLPAVFLGLAKNFLFHIDWFQLLLRDSSSIGRLNIQTLGALAGSSFLGRSSQWMVLGSTLFFLCLPAIEKREPHWPAWISLGLSCLLLTSPMSESPTYVLLAPTYVLLTLERRPWRKDWFLGLMMLCAFACSLSYSDLVPIDLWPAAFPYLGKVVGAVGIWGLSAWVLVSRLIKRIQ